MTTYNAAQTLYITGLENDIAGNSVPMAVVDYLGRVDADGMVTEQTSLNRRFGTRDLGHVRGYKLKVVSLNPAATKRGVTL